MASSSSSSESGKKGKKKKKDKKEKKGKKEKTDKKGKKEKKPSKKDDEKERKRAERAEAWNCERGDAVKQIGGLLQLDPDIDSQLEPVFEAIDGGETVRLDGLANKQARKKLRHLLQAFRLTQEDGGQAYRSSELKVSFSSIFQSCLNKAREHFVPAQPVEEEKPLPAPTPVAEKPKAPADPRAGFAGEEDEEGLAAPEAAAPPSPKKPRAKGPQLPGASVGAIDGGDSGSESDADAGPRTEGEERQGINLDNICEIESAREEWMTMAPESMAGLFVDGNGMLQRQKADAFAVKRSKEEQEAFEKAFAERGPSLLSQQQDGKFEDAKEDQERMRKRKVGASDVWGMSSKEQERQAMGQAKESTAPRRAFDPEKDLNVKKPMTSDEFSKLVENSQGALAGRFSRGGVASSFL